MPFPTGEENVAEKVKKEARLFARYLYCNASAMFMDEVRAEYTKLDEDDAIFTAP
jgi:hypothetical protein